MLFRPALQARSLRTTLLFYVVLPTALVLGASGWIGMQLLATDAERRLQEDIELVARALAGPVSWDLEQGGPGVIDSVLRSALSIGRVYGVYVYDVAGNLLASAGDIEPRSKQDGVDQVSKGGERLGTYGEMRGQRVFSYFVALNDSDGQIIGVLQLTRRRRDMDQALSSFRLISAITFVGGLLGAALLAMVTHRRAITRHVERLAHDMALVGSGQRHHRAQTAGPLEIGELAQALNQMLERIQAAQQELEHGRQVELELERRLASSEKLAAVGAVGAGVAHELGSPLSVVDGHAQRALRRRDLDPKLRNAFLAIRREIDRMTALVQQALELGHNQPNAQIRVAVEHLTNSALVVVAEDAERAKVELTLHHNDNEGIELVVDPGRVGLALVNLLRNAIQAADRQVELDVASTAQAVRFAVCDDGPGLDEQARARIFEPFFSTKQPSS